jgi:putative FMN-dependent luciferase-like monooxygenase
MTRLGFFTRVIEKAAPRERYQCAKDEIVLAERLGYDTAWIAQHHFAEGEGGVPSPLVWLASLADATSTITLGTAIITLPTEQPIRLAEDAATADYLLDGRLELGLGSGGGDRALQTFGHDPAEKASIYQHTLDTFVAALDGETLAENGSTLYPPSAKLSQRIWEATLSVAGATRAGKAGRGLMLARNQPRFGGDTRPLWEIQEEIVDAYMSALPDGSEPRILASRTVVVADDRESILPYAREAAGRMAALGLVPADGLTELEMFAQLNMVFGTAEEVAEELSRDTVLARSTEVTFQVHPIDPPHELIMRSLELIATDVAPRMGWRLPTTVLRASV